MRRSERCYSPSVEGDGCPPGVEPRLELGGEGALKGTVELLSLVPKAGGDASETFFPVVVVSTCVAKWKGGGLPGGTGRPVVDQLRKESGSDEWTRGWNGLCLCAVSALWAEVNPG